MTTSKAKKPIIKKPTVKQPKNPTTKQFGFEGMSKIAKEDMDAIRRENIKKAQGMSDVQAYEKSDKVPDLEITTADLLADIYDPRCKYAPEMKIYAATCYMLTGTTQGTARMCQMSQQTISTWKNHSEWWHTVLAAVKVDKQEELDAEITTLIHTSVGAMQDRLEHGDEIVQFKYNKATEDYDIVRSTKAISARDLTAMLNILYDKRSMLRGDPTSITRPASTKDTLQHLKDEFKGIAEQVADDKLNAKVIN